MTLLKDAILWFYWNPFRLLVQRMPPGVVYMLGRFCGIGLYYASKLKRNALKQLIDDLLDGVVSEEKSDRIIKDSFIIRCSNEVEVLLFPKLNTYNIERYIALTGQENLERALSAGKGVMLLFAHFGANQMIMPAVGYRGYKMSQISAPPTVWVEKLPQKKFTAIGRKALEIRWSLEQSLPVKHINVFGSLKDAFLCLKRNEILGIAIDGGGGNDRVAVDFLGGKALFSIGAIDIAMRTGCVVLPTFMLRDESGYNTLVIEEPMQLAEGKDRNAIAENIFCFAKRLESYVMKYPCHYLNFLALRNFMATQGEEPFLLGETK